MKTVELTNEKVLDLYQVLNQMGQSKEGSIQQKFNISKNIRILKQEVETYDLTRKQILEENALRDESGKIKTINDGRDYDLGVGEAKEKTLYLLQELLMTKVTVDLCELELAELEAFKPTALDLMILEEIIKE